MSHICQYCKRSFARPNSLVVHLCEQKKRYQEKNEAGVRLGFHSYLKFYEITQGSSKVKTYDDFSSSPYYKAFVKFGRYCATTRVINPIRFTEWILKQNKKLDYWCSDKLYEEYLLFYLTVEAMEDALARSIEHTIAWGEEKGSPSHDYLRYGNHNAIIQAIITGRISPWVLYNSESGQKFLSEMSTEHQTIVWPYINPDIWMAKLKQDHDTCVDAQNLLKKAGW